MVHGDISKEEEMIVTSLAKVWIGDHGIGHVTFLPDTTITLTAAREYIEAAARLCKGKSVPVLIDIRNVRSGDREARQYLASEEVARITKASAVLVSSPVTRILGNFFKGLNKPPYPVELFTSESDALEWLRRFLP